MKGLICNDLVKLSHGGGGGGKTSNLKRTALSCTLLTTLLTSASAARDITGNHNAFAINGETVTIKSGATVQVGSPVIGKYKGSNSSIAVGQNGKESSITIEQGGKLNGRIYTRAAKIKDIIINGSIGAGPSNASIINFRSTTIEKIEVGQTGVLEGGIINSWFKNGGTASGNSKIDNIDIKGEVKGGIKNQSGTMQTITITGSVSGGIQNDDTMDTLKIESGGSVSGDIINNKTMQNISVSGSTVNNNIQNSGTITNGVTITNSTIGGNIVNSGSNANTGAINITGTSNVGGSIINQNGANFTNSITLDQSSKLGGISNTQGSTMSGQLDLKGEVGEINNAGKFDSTLTLSNKVGQINNAEGGTITNDITINNGGSVGAINNAGTMQAITNNGTGTLTLTNSGGTIDKITNGTGATATIRNQGKITNGIINDGGTLTVFNDFRKDESAANGYHTIGEIGKTANGVHIENNNGGKLHLNAWYFNKEDFTTQEERKNNSLLVDGNYAGITLGDVFVNTSGLDVDKTYNANTLIADKNGNIVGDKINNGQGIDVNKLYSVSGIYKFENFGGKGEYRAIINRDELSGKTLAQSIIYSQRVRNVNLSRILREATTQVFVSGKESEVNGKSLSQLERLHTNHRDENSQNHTFVIPYYQNFSADLGNNAKLKSNSSGMLIATQRELPNDYGVLGIYTGFENAEQKVNAQRLDLDGNSYYAGLTYNHSFYEDDLTTYFMNLTTKLDYIERDVTKTYLGYIGSVSSTAKVFGYGANARVGLSHYLKNDAKITPQIGFNYLGMHSKPFTLNHLGGTREHYYSQNFNFIDAVATIKYETPWINRFKTSLALGTIINVYKDAEGTLHLDNNFLSSELDIARLYGVVQGGISYDLTKDSDISLGYSGIFSSANTIRSHAFMFRYAWWW
ncbi:autotransporter domain-containing protein [Campylobacter upsaliensis]|uniref:autotransporter outer membrane beta-barrel domain-containing protein n=1 Tax=Campylobacter upsaliensis TaxID=28080 RepID=UPI001603B3AE|nr:autotransporter outer membrane beta-barrel domain-containing protein [Campylobacter upsaliensis]QMU03429.1 autotransporter domain-containing protein [Campylobacter upsaliensis]